MSEPLYRRVSPCEHGIEHGIKHLPDVPNDPANNRYPIAFGVPGCTDAKGHPRNHVAGDKYPLEPLPPEPRRTRSDKGQKRGPRK